MSDLHPAVLAVRKRAEALLGDRELALASEPWPGGDRPAMMLAIARPFGSLVLAIDLTEFNGAEVFRLAGFPDAPKKTAQQVLTDSRDRA